MESKIFLDTNIILDIIVEDRTNHPLSKKLLEKLLQYDVFISEDMISTVYYVSKNKVITKNFFKVIQYEWHIVPFGKNVIEDAIDFSLQNNTDLEDTLQCFCAKKNGCLFLTNDKKFIECGIKIVDYNEFLNN